MPTLTELYEKYYSQAARDDMPAEDFAGPNQSFPIKTQADVENAATLIGHAADPDAVKRKIIAIAKRKGFTIPDAWQTDADKAKESAPSRPTILSESLDLSEATFDDNVLKNVVLIREGRSLNSRRYVYPANVLQRDGKVFEGAKAYNDHGTAHKTTDITGWYSNVRYENGALYADRHFTRNQAGQDVKAIAEDIVSGRAPKTLAGLSINASGKLRKADDGDGMQVEAIEYAESVDDVSTPARGGSYLAAGAEDGLTQHYLQALTFEQFFEARPDYIARIQNEMKTIRQDSAIKAAEQKAQAALAEADRLSADLKAVQQQLSERDTAYEAAVSGEKTARRELAIEQALNAVSLPESWKATLRTDLLDADPTDWAAIIDQERAKADSAGVKPRVAVNGAGQQTSRVQEKQDPLPPAPNWNEILSSPERFAAYQNSLRRN